MLGTEGELTLIRAEQTFASAGEPITFVFFPLSGVMSYVSEMTTGRQISVAAIGNEGLVGAAALLGIRRHAHRIVALLDCEGYRIGVESLRRAFDELDGFRFAALADIGRQLIELASLVACARVHSHRQRVARWLLMMTDKSGQSSLLVTHEVVAQMVGGPRHAVTVALGQLRREGAIAHFRGRIDVVDRTLLLRRSCECYVRSTKLIDATDLS
jgi:CRP-like cAMP-binding protein